MPARRTLLLLLVACSAPPKVPVATPPPAPKPDAPAEPIAEPDPTPPDLRLATTVRPLRHDAQLTIDPASEDFTGRIEIDLDITTPTSVVWLNQEEIKVKTATFTVAGKTIAARTVYAPKDFLALVVPQKLSGRAKVSIEYSGKMHRNDGTGIYPVKENEEWYAFTQFEAMDARAAFPCFDEPSFKVPWKLTIKTKSTISALSNTPVASEKDEGNGWKTVQFVETKPLPSYLIAFAVGPFDFVDAGKSRRGVPIRIAMPKGHTGEAAWPVEATKPLLDLLEDYFGTPYPFEKLDVISVPVFNAGAMENPGLITFRQPFILSKPAELTLAKKQNYAITIAHEIAHMWFGDFVTLAWWDDTWLNEAFATWMEAKVVDKWKPEWDGPVQVVRSKGAVMGQDSLDTARAIRQPITSIGDIETAFDGITYQKGLAVLDMLERYIGADAFQKGVRDYLAKHAWGNATYDDFVAAMTRASGKDMKPMFDAFVLQSGVPMLAVELKCEAGKAPKLELAQRRYAPTGSHIDPKRTWNLPICARWGAGGATGRDCTTLTTETGELALTAKTCPTWVLPNEGELGYYRMLPKGKLLDQLLANTKALTLPERVGLLNDINALVASGDVKNGVALTLVDTLAKDKSRFIVDASMSIVAGIDEMVPDNLRANYERLIKKLYRARALELGWQSKPGEDDNTKQLRPDVVGLVAGNGRDKDLIKQATALAWKWLDDHKSVQPDMVGVVLGVATQHGDDKLFERLHADAKKATDRAERGRLLGAMGGFADPKIVAKAMAIVLTDEFELREALGLLQGPFGDRQTRIPAYNFVKDNYDKILAKLPEPYRPFMAFTFVPLCDDGKQAEVEAFWKPRITKLDGGDRTYAQALESMKLCAAARKAQTPGVVEFLKRQ